MNVFVRGAAAGLLALVGMLPARAAGGDEETWNRCLQQDLVGPQKPDEVIAACRSVLNSTAFGPNERTDAFNNIGVAYMELQQYDDAIHYFSEALRAIRDYQDMPEFRQLANFSRRNRAESYMHTKHYDEAIADIDKMAATEPVPKYLAMRCKAIALWGSDFAAALPDCKKAIDANKTLNDAFAGWLIVEYRQGKYADVVSDCKMVQDMGAVGPDVLYVCGLAERRAGNAERGKMMVETAEPAAGEVAETFKKLDILP